MFRDLPEIGPEIAERPGRDESDRQKQRLSSGQTPQFGLDWRPESGRLYIASIGLFLSSNALRTDEYSMQKEDIVVLIVEDDQTLGQALKEVITRAGYKPLLVARPDEALARLKLQPIHAAIIDCMLPKMNGKDLAIKLRTEIPGDLPVIMTSGIFKDKSYSRDVIQATGAAAFLTKPFDLEEVLQILERKLVLLIEVPVLPIYELLNNPKPSAKERIRCINDAEQVHGFDLPWIFSLLLDERVSGHLNIITADGEVAGVGFSRGNIVQVNVKDAQSYFGVLLVEKGFISPEELEEILARGKTRRMGEQLIEANVLSPHAVNIVIAEQQSIRLSKTISNTSCKVNFIESRDISEDAQTDRNLLTELIDDWIASKLPIEWLKSFYIPWMSHEIVKGPEFSDDHPALMLNCLGRLTHFHKKAVSGLTLDQLATQYENIEAPFYRAIHSLVLNRIVIFGEQKKHVNYDAQRTRLAKLDSELEGQTFFERLGLSQKAKEQEIKRSFHELAKVLHPDKLSAETPNDVRELTRSAFGKISQAYETLSNNNQKDAYVKELEQGRAELVLQAESLTELGKTFLSKGDIKRASEQFDEAASFAPPGPELRLLMMWSKLKLQTRQGDQKFSESIRDELNQIPPEDRHNSTYYFVKGLLMKYTDNLDHARKGFEHAVAIDPDFIDARRELNLLKLQNKQNKPTDILRGDLKDVVGKLFGKKK